MQSRTFLIAIGGVYLGLMAVGAQVQRPEFRPWELLASPAGYGFAPGQRVEMREIGDLGYVTWVEALQAPRDTVFTTDAWGYRNRVDREAADVVVLGDSFTVGSGVSDDQTLPARLEARLGRPVYNFGIPRANSPSRYYVDPRFAARPPAVLVFAPNQRMLKPGAFAAADERAAAGAVEDEGLPWPEQLRSLVQVIERDNGLGRAARFAVQGARYRWRGEVPGHRVGTVDGAPALLGSLEAFDLLRSPEQRGVEAYVAGLTAFARALGARGTRLVFAPLPDQPQLYPEAYPARERERIHQPAMLDVVIERARAAGLDVVDVRRGLADAGAPYLYLRDDTHFDARALDLIAQQLAAAIAPR